MKTYQGTARGRAILCYECALIREGFTMPDDGRAWQYVPRTAVHSYETHEWFPNLPAYRAAIGQARGSYRPKYQPRSEQ